LFQKMQESCYEWDANNKELNKIHIIDEGKAEIDHCFTKMMNSENVSSTWSEEDEKMFRSLHNLIYVVRDCDCDSTKKKEFSDWIESLKSRYQSKQEQEWGEEDEKRLKSCLSILQPKTLLGNTETINTKWLKSLKDRVQSQNLTITDEELAQAKKDAYNEVLDKTEYNSDWPTFDDGWSAAIWYLKKRNGRSQLHWKPSDVQMQALKEACDKRWEPDGLDPLYTLYEQLKKL